MTEYVYRVTRENVQTKVVQRCTKTSVHAQIGHMKNEARYAERHGMPVPRIVKIERAPLREYEDVTGEFL